MTRRGRGPASTSSSTVPSLDDLTEAAIVADAAGRIVHANPACREQLGWSPDDLVGMALVELVPERLRAAHDAAFARFVATGRSTLGGTTIHVPVVGPDGDETPAELLISATGPADAPLVIGTLRRVTAVSDLDPEARIAQFVVRALAGDVRGSALTQRILAAVGRSLEWDVVTLWVLDGSTEQLRCDAVWSSFPLQRFDAASQAALFPLGVGLPGRVWELGQPTWTDDIATDPNFVRSRPALADGLRSGFAFPVSAAGRFIGVLECFDRTPRAADSAIMTLSTGVGTMIGTLLDRGLADEERSRMLDQVQTERARLQAVLRQLPLGVIVSDADGKVVLANDFVSERLGPPDADHTYRIHPTRGLSFAPGHASASSETVLVDHDVEVTTPAGTPAVLSVSSVPVHDRDGRVVSAVTTLLDVTEQRAEQARAELLAQAGELLARSLDIDQTMAAVARLCVPDLADLCLVDLVGIDREARRVASAATDAASEGVLRQLDATHGPDPDHGALAEVLRSGRPFVRSLGPRSLVIIPLLGGGQTLGALTFGNLSADRPVSPAAIEIAEELGRRAGLAVANARLYQSSREVADALQTSLLPPQLPHVPGLELGAHFLPQADGLIVGGDFYDVFGVGGGRWAIVIGDVCGKGAEAAAVTARVRYTARAVPEHDDPVALLGRVNDVLLAEGTRSNRFCTLVHGVLQVDVGAGDGADDGTVAVRLASGGHPPPLVVRTDGGISAVECRGTLLGVFDEVEHSLAELTLRPGDALVLYTDGVTDARAPLDDARGSGAFFGEQGLIDVLRASVGSSAADIAAAVGTAVRHHGGGSTSDDVAVLVARAAPPDAP